MEEVGDVIHDPFQVASAVRGKERVDVAVVIRFGQGMVYARLMESAHSEGGRIARQKRCFVN